MNQIDLAKRAYRAYGEVTDFKNYQGLPMPEWDELSPTIQQAWQAAAEEVVRVTSDPTYAGGDPEFFARNVIRKRQIAYAGSHWVRQVGDRVQLSRPYLGHKAWTAGVITNIFMDTPPNTIGMLMRVELVVVELDTGVTLTDGQSYHDGNALPLVPHEDYFKQKGQV